MTANAVIATWGLMALAGLLIGGLVAGLKNRDYSYWMAWCFLCPPALLILVMLPKVQGQRPRRPTLDEESRHD